LFELRDGRLRARGLVVRQREIQAHGVAQRIDLQRRLIVRNAVVILAQPDVGGAEIRQRIGAIGTDGQRRLVAVNRAEDVTGLVQLEGACEQTLEILSVLTLSPRGRGDQEKQDRKY
jgi:hypothetical protein